MNQDWINHPDLASIDLTKLQMLQTLANQGSQKNANEILPFLMMAMKQSKKSGFTFSQEEMNLIIEVLKQGKSPSESAKIEKMLHLLKTMKK